MREDILIALKNFWPHRSKARGFSIKNFAGKYREKLSTVSSENNSDKFSNEINLDSLEKDSNQSCMYHQSETKRHWANRDFSEYRQIA